MRLLCSLVTVISLASLGALQSGLVSYQFAVIGDRTGETQPRVYEQVWREVASEKPKFVLSVGDTIQGSNDKTAQGEWERIHSLLVPYDAIPRYLTAGNHDIWSSRSERLFQKFSQHPPHYSFDFDRIHVTVVDTSRSETLSDDEIRFLENDLKAHSQQPIKIILSHRPFWLLPVLFGASQSPVHQLLLRYGVQYVFTGHLHKMLHAELDGITYLCMPSSGGHLRDTKRYEDGWFFGHVAVQVSGQQFILQVKEAKPPVGKGRATSVDDWGVAGLSKPAA